MTFKNDLRLCSSSKVMKIRPNIISFLTLLFKETKSSLKFTTVCFDIHFAGVAESVLYLLLVRSEAPTPVPVAMIPPEGRTMSPEGRTSPVDKPEEKFDPGRVRLVVLYPDLVFMFA